MYDEKLWEGVLASLGSVLDAQLINTWLRSAKITTNGGDIRIVAKNRFCKNWIEKHYLPNISKVLQEDFGIEAPVSIDFVDQPLVMQPAIAEEPTAQAEEIAPTNNGNFSVISSKLTFENFVSGDSNGFAHSAALAVADGNFSIYNPLYIYGGTGLGKTHLMYAIANRVRVKFPKMKILYMDSETFSTEIINLFMKGERDQMQVRIEKMKDRFRSVDLFMLDDIQFMKTREKSLEFFFNIFNDFQMRQKQVVITSDESPQEIDMAERMRSRFASGFQAEIQPPTLEERVAILLQKANELSLYVDDHVALYLAENVAADNVRELVGALKRVNLYASFHQQPVSTELAEKALRDSGQLRQAIVVISPQQLITVVAENFNVKLSDVVSRKRTKSIVLPRHVAMYLLKERLNLSLKEVGSHFGGRDHSTVKHAIDNINRELGQNEILANIVAKIIKKYFG